MSLTSELSSSTSWVNRYFKNNFARVVEFTKIQGPGIKALDTKVPTELKGQSLSRVGTAIDYNIRLKWGLQPLESTVISGGIARMELFGTQNTPEERGQWAEAVRQCLAGLDERSDEGLARASILLAHLDAGFRSGGMWGEDMVRIARDAARHGWQPHRLLDVAREPETTEVVHLARLAREVLKVDGEDTPLLGPTFEGSGYVGGADADLIMGGRLYDIKTTMDPRRGLPETIRQLIGYALLDWHDEYMIRDVGVYFSRQGEKVTWELEDLLAGTATNGQTRLSEFRRTFKELAMAETGLAGNHHQLLRGGRAEDGT